MSLRTSASKDVVAGLTFACSGAVLFWWAHSYEMGSVVAMGPGYFPAICGATLVLLGSGSILKGVLSVNPNPIDKSSLNGFFLVVGSIVAFGLLIESAGLLIATFASMLICCAKRVLRHPVEFLVMFSALTIFNIAVFIYAFEMRIPILWYSI